MRWFLGGLFAFVWSTQALGQEGPSSAPSSPTSQPNVAADAALGLSPESMPATAPSSAPVTVPSVEMFRPIPPLTQSTPMRSSPSTAAFLGIVPGLGHVYLGQYGQAAGYFGSEVGLGAALVGLARFGAPGQVTGSAMQNLWFYNIFDAYRDARVKQKDVGYEHPITKETLEALASAPFRWSVLKKRWVWAGVPAALAGGLAVSLLAERVAPSAEFSFASLRPTPKLMPSLSADITIDDAPLIGIGTALFAATFVPVGVGEESLFRGCIQSGLTNQIGEIPGWIAASLLFGSIHIFNFAQLDPATGQITGFDKQALFAVPYITMVGAGLGYIYMKEDYKLSTGVAAHFWYDFLLSVPQVFLIANEEPAMIKFSFSW